MAAKKILSFPVTADVNANGTYNPKACKTTLDLRGQEETVDRLLGADAAKQAAEAEIEQCRVILEPVAEQLRNAAETEARFSKTVYLHGSERSATLAYSNHFSRIDTMCERPLQLSIGVDMYGKLFQRKKDVKVNPEKVEDLIRLLGESAKDFLVIDESIGPVKDFRETRFSLRPVMNEVQNQALDSLITQFAYKPSLKTK